VWGIRVRFSDAGQPVLGADLDYRADRVGLMDADGVEQRRVSEGDRGDRHVFDA
jgi:hypothetical protein